MIEQIRRRLHWLAFALGANGWLHQLLREEAERLIDELALISEEQGFPYSLATTSWPRPTSPPKAPLDSFTRIRTKNRNERPLLIINGHCTRSARAGTRGA